MNDKNIKFKPASATLSMNIPDSGGEGTKPVHDKKLTWLLILSGLIALILGLFGLLGD